MGRKLQKRKEKQQEYRKMRGQCKPLDLRVQERTSRNLEIDIDSWLERALTVAIWIFSSTGFMTLVIGVLVLMSDKVLGSPWSIIGLACFLLAPLLGAIRSKVREKVLYQFDKLLAALVVPHYHQNDHGQSWWTYDVSILRKDGRLLSILMASSDSNLKTAQDLARRIARVSGLKLYLGEKERVVEIKRSSEGYEVTYVLWSLGQSAKELKWIIVAIAASLVVILVLSAFFIQ